MLSLYKSSAGSGKTHTLVLEYLKIVLANPYIYRSILAVTFTNKATDEMKGRIIQALSDLATQSPKQLSENPLFLSLNEHFSAKRSSLPPDFSIADYARKVLSLVLNDYSNFSVSTIESFFQRILRAFARELNIPLGYDVETKNRYVLDRLVDEILLDVGKYEKLTQILSRFVDRNLEEEKTWNLESFIKEVGEEIFKERFQDLENERERKQGKEENYIGKTLDLAQRIWKTRKSFENRMQELGERGINLMREHGLQREDFSYGKSGVANFFFKACDLNRSATTRYEINARVRKAAEDDEAWYSKKSEKKAQILVCLDAGLRETLGEMVELVDKDFLTYNTALQGSQSVFSFGLLNELKDKLTAYRKEQGQLIISDTGLLLQKVIKDQENAPFIYEKVGTRFQHFLLDEFQDTSNMQWGNMLPLLAESLASDQFSLLVGDAKQSIYRWRNGNMELLLKEVEQDIRKWVNQEVKLENLDKNWRTASEIVEFNNWLFDVAAASLVEELQDPNFGQMMLAAYGDVEQIPQRTAFPGYVSVQFFPDREKKEDTVGPKWEELAEERCMQLIWDLIITEGFEAHEITLLVRNNQEGTRLAHYLQRESVKHAPNPPIKVVSADSLLIASDPKVQFLQALLQVLHYEHHEIHAAALQYYFEETIRGNGSQHSVFVEKVREILPGFERQKERLRRLSVYECVERLCALFDPLLDPNAYVQGFKDAVLTYASENDPGIGGFLEWWSEEKGSRAIASAASLDAVQIMTIHKSKGLEFPIVILPFADWEMPPKSRGYLWVEPQKPPYDSFEFFPMKLSSQLEKTIFKEAYKQEEQSAYLDNLNLLYVSLTRPKYRLYLLGKSPGINAKNGLLKTPRDYKTVSKLLVRALAHSKLSGLIKEGPSHYTYGRAIHREDIRLIEGEKEPALGVSIDLLPNKDRVLDWNQMLRIKYSSNQFLQEEIGQRQNQIDLGNLLHEGLAYIVTLGDEKQAAEKLFIRGLIKESEVPMVREKLEMITHHSKVKYWFDGKYQVKNEAEIIVQGENRPLRPDRVMIAGNKAILVDYKSGKAHASYAKQILRYLHALKNLGYEEVEGYLYYILSGQVEQIPFSGQLDLQF